MADDLLAVARDRARSNRFWQHLGIDVAEVREGWARLRVDVRDELRNAPGAPVHGGVYAALVDAAIGCAEGMLLRRGRTVAFGEVRVTDDAGALVAVGRATYLILPSRAREASG